MNNYTEIKAGNQTIKLLFAMPAIEEFGRLQIRRAEALKDSGMDITALNGNLFQADIVFAGAYNYAAVNFQKLVPYNDIVEALESLNDTEDGLKQLEGVWETWHQSRFGTTIKKKGDQLAAERAEAEKQPTGTKLEDTPTAA